MISAVATERFDTGALARLEPGTLRLVRAKLDKAVFNVVGAIEPGDEVWLVPLDSRLIPTGGVPVAGATVAGTGVGVEGLVTRQTGE
jgi:hypothetical protein